MKKIVIQNLSITILSKIFSFVSFLYLAKELSTNDYGVFVYVNLLLSLLPLFQLGSMHGAIILLPKYIAKKDGSERSLFWNYNSISHLIQIISVVALFLFDIDFSLNIIFSIAVNYVLSKYVENVQLYLNAKIEFQKANILKSFDQVLRPLVTLLLFIGYKNLESIFIAQLLSTIITFTVSLYFLKFEFISIKFNQSKQIIKKIYNIGFFVYLIWAIDILFRTADRWFIAQFYTLEELATYGFVSSLSMNIWLLSMSFFSPYSQLLYKHVAENNYAEAKKVVVSTNKKIYILLAIISVFAIITYPFLLKMIVHKYFGTWLLFITLVITSVFLSINNMFIYYMICSGFHFVLLKYQGFVLIGNIVLNTMFAYFHLSIIFFSYSTILTLIIYFILVRKHFYYDIEKKLMVTN